MAQSPNHGRQTLAKILLIFFLCGLSPFATALIVGSINATLAGAPTLKDNQVNTVRITWSGVSDSQNSNSPGQPYQVFSSAGAFTIERTTLGVNNRRIAANLVLGTPVTSGGFSIQETLQIPRSVLVAAKRNNSNFFEYSRAFIDESGGLGVTSSIVFQIVSSNSGSLSLSQVDLRFSNNNLNKVVKIDESLLAYATINHNGTGLFRAVWEVATPITTSGTPIFTTLETVRQFLGAGRKIVLESPTLPTNLTGNYVLRLKILSPQDSFENLQLRYAVIRSAIPTVEIQAIEVTKPLPNALINDVTVFSWNPVTGAHTYQIEIYELDNTDLPTIGGENLSINELENSTKKLSSGVLLPSEKQSSTLTKIALRNLKPGRAYRWRTVAINKEGYIIGKSQYRKIRLTP